MPRCFICLLQPEGGHTSSGSSSSSARAKSKSAGNGGGGGGGNNRAAPPTSQQQKDSRAAVPGGSLKGAASGPAGTKGRPASGAALCGATQIPKTLREAQEVVFQGLGPEQVQKIGCMGIRGSWFLLWP